MVKADRGRRLHKHSMYGEVHCGWRYAGGRCEMAKCVSLATMPSCRGVKRWKEGRIVMHKLGSRQGQQQRAAGMASQANGNGRLGLKEATLGSIQLHCVLLPRCVRSWALPQQLILGWGKARTVASGAPTLQSEKEIPLPCPVFCYYGRDPGTCSVTAAAARNLLIIWWECLAAVMKTQTKPPLRAKPRFSPGGEFGAPA